MMPVTKRNNIAMNIPAVEVIPDQPKRTIPRLRPAPSAKARPLPDRQALRLNWNLALYPLARDLRRKPKWRRSKPTGKYWLADLPGKLPAAKQMQIEMRLHADVPEETRRAPTAVDMAVLFAVMAEVQAAGGVVIGHRGERRRERVIRSVEWPSMTSLIKSVGLDPVVGSRARSQVRSALDYWQSVELIYRNVWRAKGSVAQIRKLPPPIEAVTRRGRRLVIKVAPAWRDVAAADGYYAEIPLPLPSAPAAQNLVLWTLAQDLVAGRRPQSEKKGIRKLDTRWLTRKVGLDSSRRNATLETAVEAARAWFVANDGDFQIVTDVFLGCAVPPGQFWVFAMPVRIPRRRTLTRSEREPPRKRLGRNANPGTPKLGRNARP